MGPRAVWAAWLAEATLAGVGRGSPVPTADALPGALDLHPPLAPPAPLDLPGRPVPIATPGHTSGHTAFHLPDTGVVVTGDALVTGHPTSTRRGPQMLDDVFHHVRTAARDVGLDALARLDADVVLPGHGPVHHGPVAAAVARARE